MCQKEESNKLTNIDYLANKLAEQRRKIAKNWKKYGLLKGLTLNKNIKKFTADGVKICTPLKIKDDTNV